MKTLVLCIALFVLGCSGNITSVPVDEEPSVIMVNKAVRPTSTIYGTVRYIDISGGFYGIVTDDGNNVYPLNLPSKCKKDGLHAKFVGEYTITNTTVMWGRPFMINSVWDFDK